MLSNLLNNPVHQKIIILLSALLVYANTVQNDYALDDAIVITNNTYVSKGTDGLKKIFTTETFTGFFNEKKQLVEGGRYRPLSVASFAIEHQIWGMKAGLSHVMNALFFGLLCVVLFNSIMLMCSFLGEIKMGSGIAFFACILFAVHPIHTEVVANIKGRDEIFALLFLLLSINYALRTIQSAVWKNILLSAIFLFLGLLSKENAIMAFPILLVIIIIQGARISIKKVLPLLLFLLLTVGAYLLIRISILGGLSGSGSNELMNNPYLFAATQQKVPTILYTLLVYIKLLFIPHPLTYDYYPYHITLRNWNDMLVWGSLLINLLLLILAFIFRKREKLISLGILFYVITLLPLTNFFVNIGTFMNERFLFLPSVGFVIVAGTLVSKFIFAKPEKFVKPRWFILGFILILLVFSAKTVSRNTIWKDNFTLFTHDINVSEGSAKGNCTAGGILYETAQGLSDRKSKDEMFSSAITYLEKAVDIYPDYIDALLLLGNAHFELNRNMSSVNLCYNKIFALSPNYKLAYSNYKLMLKKLEVAKPQVAGLKKLIEIRSDDFEVYHMLGTCYGKKLGQLDSAIVYLQIAHELQPENPLLNRDLGVAYAIQQNYAKSLHYFAKTVELSPADPENFINLGLSFQNLGRLEKAKQAFMKADSLKKN